MLSSLCRGASGMSAEHSGGRHFSPRILRIERITRKRHSGNGFGLTADFAEHADFGRRDGVAPHSKNSVKSVSSGKSVIPKDARKLKGSIQGRVNGSNSAGMSRCED